jgi:8-oxo-dGTP pyrophosphatase MutT (NUDIX family)
VTAVEWKVHGERSLYESEWMSLRLVDVEIPGERRFEHHVVRYPAPAAGVVVFDPARGVLLLWRHRFITDTWGWEVPAGKVDTGETPEQGAAREVLEETGWRPGPLRHLASYHPTNGVADQTFHLFVDEPLQEALRLVVLFLLGQRDQRVNLVGHLALVREGRVDGGLHGAVFGRRLRDRVQPDRAFHGSDVVHEFQRVGALLLGLLAKQLRRRGKNPLVDRFGLRFRRRRTCCG